MILLLAFKSLRQYSFKTLAVHIDFKAAFKLTDLSNHFPKIILSRRNRFIASRVTTSMSIKIRNDIIFKLGTPLFNLRQDFPVIFKTSGIAYTQDDGHKQRPNRSKIDKVVYFYQA